MIGPMIMMMMMKTVAFILKKHLVIDLILHVLNCKTKCRSNLKQSSFLHLFLCVTMFFFFVEVPRRSHLKTVSVPNPVSDSDDNNILPSQFRQCQQLTGPLPLLVGL